MEADCRTRWRRALVRTRAVRERGGRDITAGSTGSTPSDCAGGPSMRMSISLLALHNQCQTSRLTDPKNLHGVERVLKAKECA